MEGGSVGQLELCMFVLWPKNSLELYPYLAQILKRFIYLFSVLQSMN